MAFHPTDVFEVHVSVSDRKRSTEFYKTVLGCTVAQEIDRRDVTFLWMGGHGKTMIGLWGPTCPNPPISRGTCHFAMRMPAEEVETASRKLRELGVTPLDFDGKPTDEPVVIGWSPSVSVYFQDPDGHSLEFIAMLQDKPDASAGVLPLSAWRRRTS